MMMRKIVKLAKGLFDSRPRAKAWERRPPGRAESLECVLAALTVALLLALPASRAAAQAQPAMPAQNGGGGSMLSYTANPVEAPVGQSAKLKLPPVGKQQPPNITFSPNLAKQLESIPWPNNILLHQWTPTREVPGESIFSHRYMLTRDRNARSLTLKQAIYLALRNNPEIVASSMGPLISLQAVRQSWAAFDPNLSAQLDTSKVVTPSTSVLQSGGSLSTVNKYYDWDFDVSKVLATTNGTLGITFNNTRAASNSTFAAVNPSYTPQLEVSLDQPLLRNFGNEFATINVRIAQSNQKQSQYNYEQQLNDFVLRVATDYWNVVRAEMNLEVARQALAVDTDLVRQNTISVKVGVMAPLQLKEAQSAQATDQAAVYTVEGNLRTARATLRQDVMYNPSHSFLPATLEVSERPHPNEMPTNEERSLELAMLNRPELAAMRQGIESLLLQVKYAENQTLPQLNIGAEIGITSTAGTTVCTSAFGGSSTVAGIPCARPDGSAGVKLPFQGQYPVALNRLFRFTWYNYAVVLSFQRPLDNDAAKAALAQARMQYEQERMLYRNQISQVVVDVEQAISAVDADYKTAQAAKVATDFAASSLHDERETFRVGMATTHELLQYIQSLVAAEANQVQADVNFEIAKLQLQHAQGTLLRYFNIDFQAQNPDVKPWYGNF